jgi:hypothetical protein
MARQAVVPGRRLPGQCRVCEPGVLAGSEDRGYADECLVSQITRQGR